jgi:negative regulator of sigma E activity
LSSRQEEGSEEQDVERQEGGSKEQEVKQAESAKKHEPQQRRLPWKMISPFAICALVLLVIVLAIVLTLGGNDPGPNKSDGNLPTPNTPTQNTATFAVPICTPTQPPSQSLPEDLFSLILLFSPGTR